MMPHKNTMLTYSCVIGWFICLCGCDVQGTFERACYTDTPLEQVYLSPEIPACLPRQSTTNFNKYYGAAVWLSPNKEHVIKAKHAYKCTLQTVKRVTSTLGSKDTTTVMYNPVSSETCETWHMSKSCDMGQMHETLPDTVSKKPKYISDVSRHDYTKNLFLYGHISVTEMHTCVLAYVTMQSSSPFYDIEVLEDGENSVFLQTNKSFMDASDKDECSIMTDRAVYIYTCSDMEAKASSKCHRIPTDVYTYAHLEFPTEFHRVKGSVGWLSLNEYRYHMAVLWVSSSRETVRTAHAGCLDSMLMKGHLNCMLLQPMNPMTDRYLELIMLCEEQLRPDLLSLINNNTTTKIHFHDSKKAASTKQAVTHGNGGKTKHFVALHKDRLGRLETLRNELVDRCETMHQLAISTMSNMHLNPSFEMSKMLGIPVKVWKQGDLYQMRRCESLNESNTIVLPTMYVSETHELCYSRPLVLVKRENAGENNTHLMHVGQLNDEKEVISPPAYTEKCLANTRHYFRIMGYTYIFQNYILQHTSSKSLPDILNRGGITVLHPWYRRNRANEPSHHANGYLHETQSLIDRLDKQASKTVRKRRLFTDSNATISVFDLLHALKSGGTLKTSDFADRSLPDLARRLSSIQFQLDRLMKFWNKIHDEEEQPITDSYVQHTWRHMSTLDFGTPHAYASKLGGDKYVWNHELEDGTPFVDKSDFTRFYYHAGTKSVKYILFDKNGRTMMFMSLFIGIFIVLGVLIYIIIELIDFLLMGGYLCHLKKWKPKFLNASMSNIRSPHVAYSSIELFDEMLGNVIEAAQVPRSVK